MHQETATRRSHVFSPDHSGNIVVPSASHDAHVPGNSINGSASHGNMNGGGNSRATTLSTQTTRRAVPGRARKRKGNGTKRKSKSSSFWRRCYSRCWCKDLVQSFSSLFLAVLLWYSLGVISIGSSKLLLSGSGDVVSFGRVDPLFLTLQQLLIGSTLLRFLLKIHFLDSPGVQPLGSSTPTPSYQHNRRAFQLSTLVSTVQSYPPHLILSGLYFSLGFLATNYGFSRASASFVETIKAAEPITSATVAVWWGIEMLSSKEVTSLATIVCGVLLSTLGNRHQSTAIGEGASTGSTLSETAKACLIIMASNLCFSFRGLYQKLFRATGVGRVIDDLNLQFRMQQLGVVALILPALFWNVPSGLFQIWTIYSKHGFSANGIVLKYLALSLINGFAFTSYNLASTYILSRISVVHHAALNCIRRIFAIVVTSIAFNVPITIVGSLGILLSLFGFMSFTHFKVQRQRTPKPVSSLLPVSAVK